MKVTGVSVRNLIIASLFPGMLAAVFGVMYLGYWALALGLIYSLVYFVVYLGTEKILNRKNLNNSVLATSAVATLIPFFVAYLAMQAAGASNSFSAAIIFAFLGLIGGLYLGYLNKTS